MSYEIPYNVTVNVPGLIDEAGVDLTAEKAAVALEALAAELRANPQDVKTVFGKAGYAEHEDRWVLRSTTVSNSIRKADGGWVTVKSCDVDIADTVSSDRAANMGEVGADAIWTKPEDIYGLPVLATFKDDLDMVNVQADISEWLAKSDLNSLKELVDDQWGFGYGADAIYYALEAQKNPNVVRLANFLELRPQSPNGDTVGFSVEVDDPDQAKAFLKEARPDFFDKLFPDEGNMAIEP